MPIGFGMRILPGVRIKASTRGIGVGLGPRAARLNVGTRGVGASTGIGPFWASTGVGHKRSRRRGPAQPSLKSYERELKRAQRAQGIAEAARKEQLLISVHLEEFSEAQPQEALAPEPINRDALLKDFTSRAHIGIPWYKFSERRVAKTRAIQQAEQAIREKELRIAKERVEEQARLDASWRQLLSNVPETVLAVLEEAFEDNQSPAAPINCEGDEATVMMLYESPDLIPDHKPARTPSGNPTLHKRTKTERNELYAHSMASNILATAKEAFAVAPGIKKVAIMVVRKDEASHLTQPLFSCLYCGRFQRSRFAQLNWNQTNPLAEISATPGALIKRKGRTAEIYPLDISDVPDLAAVLQGAAEGLGGKADIKPTDTNLDTGSAEQKEDKMTESNMEKHTISIGTDTIGETVTFTAKRLGTAEVNGGKKAEGGVDWTYYRLPDHTYRVLGDNGSVSILEPSNMAEAMGRGEPVEYGRWTLEELQDEGEYGRVFGVLMENHPEGGKRIVRDLD